MQWFKSKKHASWTALRCTADSTYVAQVTMRANQKPLVKLAEVETCSLNDAANIKKLAKKYQLNQSHVSYLLEHSDYELVQVEKPKVPIAELKEAVRWQLKDSVKTSVEDATIDIIDIPQDKQASNSDAYVYAVVSANQVISSISNRLLDEKVNLQAIDVRMMAQRNIANLLAVEGQGEAILSFSRNGALLTFTYQGEIYNARRIDIDTEKTESAFEKISLELQRSLDGFEAKYRNIFIKKLLVAPFDLREKFCEHLREAIYTKVETFDLADIFEFPSNIDLGSLSRQASFTHVLGAAMRDEVTT